MVDKKDAVFAAADRLRAKGKRVTQEAVRKELKGGGSYRDIGRPLLEWKKFREYGARLELTDMPKEIRERFEGFVREAWKSLKARAGEDLVTAMTTT